MNIFECFLLEERAGDAVYVGLKNKDGEGEKANFGEARGIIYYYGATFSSDNSSLMLSLWVITLYSETWLLNRLSVFWEIELSNCKGICVFLGDISLEI